MPRALKTARMIARRRGAFDRIEDCQQIAVKALLEARLRYDKTRGPFSTYAWKRVAGAVMRYLRREDANGWTGLDNALDATETMHDDGNPFADEDSDALAKLAGCCDEIAFTWYMGDTASAFIAQPERALVRAQAFEGLSVVLGPLDDRQKQFVELRYLDQLTWEAVAASLGVDERTARRIDERLRSRLRRGLRQQGVEEPPPSAPT
jgi:RNA polymerase sigma factor for flagellar operon FliA